mmetsp:Transcript_4404/g.7998  ORF Transcript_4404/g.7998 Transcript_4404/m.7998 type:complete len:220 (+) Transcript_4404:1514-2173(+)
MSSSPSASLDAPASDPAPRASHVLMSTRTSSSRTTISSTLTGSSRAADPEQPSSPTCFRVRSALPHSNSVDALGSTGIVRAAPSSPSCSNPGSTCATAGGKSSEVTCGSPKRADVFACEESPSDPTAEPYSEPSPLTAAVAPSSSVCRHMAAIVLAGMFSGTGTSLLEYAAIPMPGFITRAHHSRERSSCGASSYSCGPICTSTGSSLAARSRMRRRCW